MKHCPECGEKLEVEKAKYCPNCGQDIGLKNSEKSQNKATNSKPIFWSVLVGVIIGLALLAIFAVAFPLLTSPQSQSTSLSQEITQQNQIRQSYNQYSEIYSKDIEMVNKLRNQYNSISIQNNFEEKASAAQTYALEAKKFIAHMDDFRIFLIQNQAEIQKLGVNVPQVLAELGSNKETVQNTAQLMAQQLQTYAEASEQRQAAIANILKLLLGFV